MRQVKQLGEIGGQRFALYLSETGVYQVRYADGGRQRSKSLRCRDLEEAERRSLDVIAGLISPTAVAKSAAAREGGDILFAEAWPAYLAARAEEISPERVALLRTRYRNYYEREFGSTRLSAIAPNLKTFATSLSGPEATRIRVVVQPDGSSVESREGKLSPNTVQEIVDTVRACANMAIKKHKPTDVDLIDKVNIAGFQHPRDRTQKGRYVGFDEIGAMVDAAARGAPHNLDMLLLELGTCARSGSLAELTIDQLRMEAGVFDLHVPGTPKTAKGRPIVPISGPMWWVLRRRLAKQVADRRVILDRSEGVSPRTRFQVIQRIAKRSSIENPKNVNWYSIRHTLSDWLDTRKISNRARGMMLGHILWDTRQKRLVLDPESPSSMIYRREQLEPLLEVAELLEAEWWPQIQAHCTFDLRLGEAEKPVYADTIRYEGAKNPV